MGYRKTFEDTPPSDLPHYVQVILNHLYELTARNPRVTISSFSKMIGMSASGISRIIDQERIPNSDTIRLIATGLELSEAERRAFEESCLDTFKTRSRETNPIQQDEIVDFGTTIFDTMNTWYHLAILELAEVNQGVLDSTTDAKRLGVTEEQFTNALNDLLMLEMLARDVNGNYQKTAERRERKNTSTTNPYLIALQKQFLNKAIDSLKYDPVDLRSVSTLTLPVNPEQIELAKKMIQEFSMKLCDYLKCGEKTEVYNLTITLTPATRSNRIQT